MTGRRLAIAVICLPFVGLIVAVAAATILDWILDSDDRQLTGVGT